MVFTFDSARLVNGNTDNQQSSLFFDGTTRVCKAFGVVLSFVVNFKIIQVVLNLSFLATSMSANDSTCELVSVLIQTFGLDPSLCLGFSHNRANNNNFSMETLTVGIIFYYAEDWACVSRTLDYVGEHFERIIARSTTRHISTSALLHML